MGRLNITKRNSKKKKKDKSFLLNIVQKKKVKRLFQLIVKVNSDKLK